MRSPSVYIKQKWGKLVRKVTEYMTAVRHAGSSGARSSRAAQVAANVFWAHFAHSFFSQVHKSYLDRSKGHSDDTGAIWAPLAASTIRRKKNLSKRHKKVHWTKTDFLKSRFIPASKAWGSVYSSHFSRLSATMGTAGAHLEATRIAWGVLRKAGLEPKVKPTQGIEVPIMIDSGRLIRSYRPGTISRSRYYPPAEQVFEVDDSTVTVGTMVPYAKYAERKRPVLHSQNTIWVRKALAQATNSMATRITMSDPTIKVRVS
jgi:hypothetical protein